MLDLALSLALFSSFASAVQDDGPTHIGAPGGTTLVARPTDVAIDAAGAPWILESAGARIAVGRARLRLSIPDGPAPARPSGLAPLADGRFAWCDAERHVVVLQDLEGAALLLASRGRGDRDVFAPEGLDAAGQRLAIADTGNRRVTVHDLAAGGPPLVVGAGRLVRPLDVALLDDGRIAVVDADTSRVEVFAADGEWSHGFGDWGYFPGLLAAPQGLDARGGRLYVADTDNHRIQVYEPDGALVYSFGTHAILPGDGDGALHYPTDVCVADDGRCAWIAEPLDGRVQRFDRAPGAEPLPDPRRPGAGQPAAHFGRVADVDGNFMVIAEPESRRVLLYDLRLDDPVSICSIGTHGRRLGMMLRPTGLHLDAARRELLVADAALHRISLARLRIDPDEPLRQDPARERWVFAVDLDRLGAGVLGAGARPIEPGALDRGPGGRAVVVDVANGRVLELGDDLVPTRVLAGPDDGLVAPSDVAHDADGGLWIADPGAGALWRRAPEGGLTAAALAPGTRPESLTVTPDGRVVASDTRHQQLVVLADGREVARWGGTAAVRELAADDPEGTAWTVGRGLGALEFCEPAGLGVDGRGRLLVVDFGNHRGQVLDLEGRIVHAFGSRFYVGPMGLGR